MVPSRPCRGYARTSRNSACAHGGQEHGVEGQPAIARHAEAQDVDADQALHPDQQADDAHGDAQLRERPGDGRPEIPPQGDLVLVVIGQLGQHGVDASGLLA